MPFMTGLIVNVGLGTGGWSVFITVHVSLSIMGTGTRLMGVSCYNWEQEAGQSSQQFMYHRASGGGYQVDGGIISRQLLGTVWFTDPIWYQDHGITRMTRCLLRGGDTPGVGRGQWKWPGRVITSWPWCHPPLIILICNHIPVNTNLTPVPSSTKLMTFLHSSTFPQRPGSDYFLTSNQDEDQSNINKTLNY